MKKSTILQIPIKRQLRDKALRTANKQGFSSLQEFVRVLLTQATENQLVVGFSGPPVKLSAKNDARYSKMIDDVLSGKVKTKSFSSVDELMADLNRSR